MPIQRRDLLKLSAWAAATGLFSPWRSFAADAAGELPAARIGKPKRVIVVGAGLSGLVAAHELVKLGHEVTLLEAQNRAGGRVLTVREPWSDGLYSEAGAARIPDNHALTLHYVNEFGLQLAPFFPSGSRVYCVGEKRIRTREDGEFDLREVPLALRDDERVDGLWPLLERYIKPALEEIGDPWTLDLGSATARKFDALPFNAYLRECGASEAAIDLLEWPWATARDDRISCLWTLREIAFESQETRRSKIIGGNDQLPRAFADRLRGRIHYGAPVVRIEQDDREVRAIAALRAGAHRTFVADRLICTVPFPKLRGIEIAPALSAAKRKAIYELAYDTVVRTALQCRTRYWQRDRFNGFGQSDAPQQVWHFSHDQPGPRGILVSFFAGPAAERVSAMEAEARDRYIIDEMERVHPGLKANLEAMVVKVWHQDPWTQGALGIPGPGQMTSLMLGAEKPEGRIHFAGEHLSRFQAWMQGALESGLRAMREVNAA